MLLQMYYRECYRYRRKKELDVVAALLMDEKECHEGKEIFTDPPQLIPLSCGLFAKQPKFRKKNPIPNSRGSYHMNSKRWYFSTSLNMNVPQVDFHSYARCKRHCQIAVFFTSHPHIYYRFSLDFQEAVSAEAVEEKRQCLCIRATRIAHTKLVAIRKTCSLGSQHFKKNGQRSVRHTALFGVWEQWSHKEIMGNARIPARTGAFGVQM
ncbi:hypothetical protein DFS34DRAFT_21777 [Phlyctochytrium arcticum]|nr:hypothetical protein DFS34DRAFT_21777 [Phlyctochytrium arcticum]